MTQSIRTISFCRTGVLGAFGCEDGEELSSLVDDERGASQLANSSVVVISHNPIHGHSSNQSSASPSMSMQVAVVIPTLGRNDVLVRLLEHLGRQTRPPDVVIVSAPDYNPVFEYQPRNFEIRYIFGTSGLCAQRNRAMLTAMKISDIVTFFDDDFLPSDRYLERLVEHFERHGEVAAMMGHVVVDGAKGAGLTFNEGLMALRAFEADVTQDDSPRDQVGTYGCNMSLRTAAIGDLRFDERLPLYGWQEDIDFTSRLRQRGRIVSVTDMIGVHLGVKSGRVSGVRFGYSQIVNPMYMIRKGSIPKSFGVKLIMRNVTANALRSVWPESFVDRRGRLKGNVLAAFHLLQGRIEPEHILKL